MSLFGSSPFGSSSSSPFGSVPSSANPFSTTTPSNPFGANPNANLFGSKPFGSPAFGQTSSSLFGGTATGVFGTQASPLGTSAPAFGASSTPAFGSSSSPFASTFGQKPATTFGGFGSSAQTNPFNSTLFGQSQPAFGSQPFGSSTPAFGATTSAFGSTTPAFGFSTPAFGASSTPAFGASSTPAFGASSTPAFGASSAPAFGASSMPTFGASSTPAFGSSTSAFGSTSIFGQSASAFGSNSGSAFGGTSLFGSTSAPAMFSTPAFGTASSPAFGSAFGTTPFGGQKGGSRAVPYSVTNDTDAGVSGQVGKLMSISAMPSYKNKSHEELRWEDYQAGDKGGPNPVSQLPATGVFGQSSPSLFGASTPSPFGQPSTPNPFASSTSNLFSPKTPAFGTPNIASPFGSTPAFGAMPSSSFGMSSTTPAFGAGTVPAFGSAGTSPLFASSAPSPFASAFGSSSSGGFGSTVPSFGSTPAFSSPSPLFQTPNAFAASQTSGGLFSNMSSPFASTPAFQSSSAGAFGSNIFGNTSSLFQATRPAMTQPTPIFGGFTQSTGSFGFGGLGQQQQQQGPGQSSFIQQAVIPVPVSNPFGTLPAMPQMSIGRSTGAAPSIQYGISSLPVPDKPSQVRTTTLLTPRHLSKIRMQARRYTKDTPKVSFFSDGEEITDTTKSIFVPRDNPRALFIRPTVDTRFPLLPAKAAIFSEDVDIPAKYDGQRNGTVNAAHSSMQEPSNPLHNWSQPDFPDCVTHKTPDVTETLFLKSSKQNGLIEERKGNASASVIGDRSGGVASGHSEDVEALIPKLRNSDYYIEPRIQELAAKERADPGYCRRVPDFIVGRRGFGFVKFLGDTDVRGIDVESIIQFNKCEVIVYPDDSKKPPVGMGLNKPAEIVIFNVKCLNKDTGQHYSEGPEAEKFEKRLKRKTEEQGAKFLSFDPGKGEWRFRVEHFSRYAFRQRILPGKESQGRIAVHI